jgi:hypothetical protein
MTVKKHWGWFLPLHERGKDNSPRPFRKVIEPYNFRLPNNIFQMEFFRASLTSFF